jgi:WG containing repeat
MKFIITLIAILGSLCPILSQNITFSCSYTGTTEVITAPAFENDDLEDTYDVKGIVDRILGKYNIPSGNIIVQSSSQVNNANAAIKDGKPYILFSKYFVGTVQTKSESTWRLAGIFAHEIAHHVLFHTMGNNVSRRDLELQADKWAGAALYRLGASLEQALVCVNETSLNGSATHPPRSQRETAVKTGWQEANGQGNNEDKLNPKIVNLESIYPFRTEDKRFIRLVRNNGSKGKYAIMKPNGEIISDYIFDDLCCGGGFHWDYYKEKYIGDYGIKSNGKYGLIDMVSGQILVNCEWESVHTSDRNTYTISSNGLFGFIDINQNIIISCQYSFAGSFSSDGLAYVKNKIGKYGYIDMNNKLIIDYQFDGIANFINGIAIVRKGDYIAAINTQGIAVPKWYKSSSTHFQNSEDYNYLITDSNNLLGVIDLHTNTLIIDYQYESISIPSDTNLSGFKSKALKNKYGNSAFAYAVLKGKKIIIDKQGNYVAEQ